MTGYAPLNTLKPVAEGLWVIDGPAVICRRMPYSTRAMVARLQNGDVWVHSPTPLTKALQAEIAALGPVGHLVAPNWDHTCFMGDWQAAFPDAAIWAVPNDGERGSGLAYDHALGDDAPWQDEIDQLIVAGSRKYREVVFFHHASKTLIVTDLIHNFDTAKLPAWARPVIWLCGTDNSDGKMPPGMRRSFRDAELLADAAEHMINWRPRRLIPAHGDWFDADAVAKLEHAFRRQLKERLWTRALRDMDAAKR